MATIALGFNISASATGMAQGVNAAAVELEKLGYAAKKTASDVGVLKTLSIGRAFVDGIQAIASAVGRGQELLRGFVDESVSIGEEASKSNVIFGKSAEAVSAFAESASAIGLSTRAALQATGTFGNLFTAIGLTQDQSAQMSVEITKLASDLASFNNTTVDEAVLALSAALRGEAEPIRRYGVLLNEATLKQIAFANGLASSTSDALSPAAKAQAAYLAILQQTVNAQGDFMRTSDSLANQQRILSAEFANTRATIGDSLQPAFAAFVAGLRDAIPAFQSAGLQIGEFLKGIDFGQVVQAGVSAFTALTQAVTGLLSVIVPVATAILPAMSTAIAFISENSTGAGIAFGLMAGSIVAYQVAAVASTIATAGLGVAIRSLLASTGIGALVVGLGLLAGAAIEYAVSSKSAADAAGTSTASIQQQTESATAESKRLAAETAATIKESFGAAEDAAKKAAAEAKRASDAARREADASIGRLITDQQFGGDSQRYAAAQAVLSINADIKRTEEEIAAARAAGDQDALNAATLRLSQLDQAKKREEDIASGAAKAAKERLKLEADYAKAREAFDEKRLAALARPSTELLNLEDTRTASGYAALQRFSQDQSDDPAIEEYRKQLKELQAIRRKIGEVGQAADTVDILGG